MFLYVFTEPGSNLDSVFLFTYNNDKGGDILSDLSVLNKRIWELDFLKGIALIFMIWDHFIFDFYGFFGVDTSPLGFFEEGIGVISAMIFMTVCGISVTLGKHNIKHGMTTFSLGVALTLFTYLLDLFFDAGALIVFGILHFLGLAMIIGHFVKKLPVPVIALLCIGSYALGLYFDSITVNASFLFPFGLLSRGFYSSDYFPLFPNLAYVFFGIIIGKTLYKKRKSLLSFVPKKSFICFLGRNTLLLYFAHQPVVIVIVFLIVKLFKL